MTDTELEASVVEATIDGVIKQYLDGTWAVRIKIDPPQVQAFLNGFREIGTRVAIAKLGKAETAPAPQERQQKRALARGERVAKGPWGEQARELRLHIDWMGNPKVWAMFGSDDMYLEWCEQQQCCVRSIHCTGDVVAAHVRRIANGAGTAIKPPFSAVPLCHLHHMEQHHCGEGALGGKDWFDQQRMKHVHDWLWHAIKEHFQVASMSSLAPEALLEYARHNEMDHYLPECYRS